jgi:hypothetical protein
LAEIDGSEKCPVEVAEALRKQAEEGYREASAAFERNFGLAQIRFSPDKV